MGMVQRGERRFDGLFTQGEREREGKLRCGMFDSKEEAETTTGEQRFSLSASAIYTKSQAKPPHIFFLQQTVLRLSSNAFSDSKRVTRRESPLFLIHDLRPAVEHTFLFSFLLG